MLGTVGHLLILVAFMACGLSGFAYFQSAQYKSGASDWKRIARAAWGLMAGCLLVAYGVLVYLMLTNQFQYAYVYQYSSLSLPLKYLFSASWAGQEGSFLLWIMYTGLIGFLLIKWAKSWEAPVMATVAFCQFFLLSMIVGLKIGALNIGSSPFAMLYERFPDAPIFQQNPGFVPADGNGLNDLLQNPWMVIHPPTLFIGFATMVVPFAYAVAGLWYKKYTEWVRPALPWALFATMILGVGISMGGYWAYVTLSFGGYWAWDPVENSSLVPWIVGVAAVHTMIAQKKSGSSQKAAIFLNMLAFILVIYSTFLTRSGILGDISVHSFVDLGLSGQLLIWILAIAALGFGLFAARYRELPTPRRESNVLSREFMIFSGAMLLCTAAAVILLGTSAPIMGRIFRESPSAVPISFYNKWTLPLTIGFVFLAGLGQLFWWTKMSVENVNRVLLKPLALSVVSTLLVLVFTPFVERTINPAAAATDPQIVQAGFAAGLGEFWSVYGMGILLLLLVFVAFFALYGNGLVMWRIGRGNPKLAGGAISHIGFMLMVLGIIASSGFSNPLGSNSGVQLGDSRDNFVLARGETRTVDGYEVTYAGQETTPEGYTSYVLNFEGEQGRAFTLKPVVYKSNKEQWIQHPDLQLYVEKDIYAAVTPSAMFESDTDNAPGELTLARGDSTMLGNQEFTLTFNGFDLNIDKSTLPDSTEIAVAALLNVTNLRTGETRTLRPVYIIMRDRMQQSIQNRVDDWNLTVAFTGMNVNSGEINLAVAGVDVKQEDWLVVQAYEKPFINLLWIGIIIFSGGFCLAMYRRIMDQQFSKQRTPVAA
jgi:cytochrome c-type biogenesis protein CcmF